MKTITWLPGSMPKLDLIYDNLREERHRDKSHRLWMNYSKEYFEDSGVAALTIFFNDNDQPELCSSISSRSCWPENCYRLLNRMWKVSNRQIILKRVSDSVGLSIISQIEWLKKNTNYRLAFMSRETSNWENWTIKNLKTYFSLEFKTDGYKYLTCLNENDNSCWQRIIYQGDEKVLKEWKTCL
jgi:hypothetical protein